MTGIVPAGLHPVQDNTPADFEQLRAEFWDLLARCGAVILSEAGRLEAEGVTSTLEYSRPPEGGSCYARPERMPDHYIDRITVEGDFAGNRPPVASGGLRGAIAIRHPNPGPEGGEVLSGVLFRNAELDLIEWGTSWSGFGVRSISVRVGRPADVAVMQVLILPDAPEEIDR